MRSLSDPPKRRSRSGRSLPLLESSITLLGIASALLLLRLLFRLLSIPNRVWSGQTLYAITDPLVLPFALLPSGDRPVIASATLADITAAALVFIIPWFLLSRRRGIP
ncbi:MAG: hypothetical protein ACR2J8_03045 [Thermomicrobiales bacterium]